MRWPAPDGLDPQALYTGFRSADVDGDGNQDLLSGGAGVQIAFGNGDGTFLAPFTAAAPQGAGSAAVGDFNGDGLPDLVYTDGTSLNVLLAKPR